MDNVIYQGSPLAAYLEGKMHSALRLRGLNKPTLTLDKVKGKRNPTGSRRKKQTSMGPPPHQPNSHLHLTGSLYFSRRFGRSCNRRAKYQYRAMTPLELYKRPGRYVVLFLHNRYVYESDGSSFAQRTVKSTVGAVNDSSFLEQFRYIIVASQLLNEQSGQCSCKCIGSRRRCSLRVWTGLLSTLDLPNQIWSRRKRKPGYRRYSKLCCHAICIHIRKEPVVTGTQATCYRFNVCACYKLARF
jgi:hypothetical protein